MQVVKIAAGIVTFNPDMKRLKENINSVLKQVDTLIVADNGSQNIYEINQLTNSFSNVYLIKNQKNMGIAYALNQLVHFAKDDFEWLLTLDQDSVILDGLIPTYCQYLTIPNVALLCCNMTDRNYDIPKKNRENSITIVKKCITSGTLTNIKKCLEVGGFDEKLFIDSVDYDLCYTLAEHGYHTLKVNYNGLLHEVGKSTLVRFGKIAFPVNHHSALRKYYISRNSVYMIYKHKLNPVIEYFFVVRRIFTVLFFEKEKTEKIKAILKGIQDGLKMAKKDKDDSKNFTKEEK